MAILFTNNTDFLIIFRRLNCDRAYFEVETSRHCNIRLCTVLLFLFTNNTDFLIIFRRLNCDVLILKLKLPGIVTYGFVQYFCWPLFPVVVV